MSEEELPFWRLHTAKIVRGTRVRNGSHVARPFQPPGNGLWPVRMAMDLGGLRGFLKEYGPLGLS